MAVRDGGEPRSFLWLMAVVLASTVAVGGADREPDARDHDTPVLCYVGSWARYRTGDGFFDASSFDPRLCSHVIYSFVGLDADTHRIKILDAQAEKNVDEGGKDGLKSYVALKERFPTLKVLVAVGGWTEGSEKYSTMAASPESRKTFVGSVVEFLRKYRFDGLDVDWEYPTQRGGKPRDKETFSLLLQELRSAFEPHGWMLSVAIAAGQYIIDQAYDIPTVAQNVDSIHVMTYDYHGKWENKTGHNAPLYSRKDGHDAVSNVNHTIHRLMALGAPREKLVLGLPFYGRTFTLDDSKNVGVGAAAHEPGPKGPFTQEANYMGYHEICQELTSLRWTRKRDEEQKVPYAHDDRSWISYDDDVSLGHKVRYALDVGLHGVMVWSIETDDVVGKCHGKPMFLLKAVHEVLAREHRRRRPPSTEAATTTTTVPSDEENVVPDDEPPHRGKGSDAHSVHASLRIGMILTVWALHVLKRQLDVGG